MRVLFLNTESQWDISCVPTQLSSVLGSCDVMHIKMPLFYKSMLGRILNFWARYFLLATKAFVYRNRYEIIVSWHGLVGLSFGFLRRLCFTSKPKVITLSFIYRHTGNSILSKLKRCFTRFALKGVDCVVCFSQKETFEYAALFKLENTFQFVPYGLNVPDFPNPWKCRQSCNIRYILSAGKSNRDYKTLFEAVRQVDVNLIVIAQKGNLTNLYPSRNVKVFFNVPYRQYIEFLKNALFAVIPLKDPNISGGQLVFLEAMALGKAVIVSRTFGPGDYIEDMKTGVFVEPGNSCDLRNAILYLLKNENERERIGKNAQAIAHSKFSRSIFAENIANLVLTVVNKEEVST